MHDRQRQPDAPGPAPRATQTTPTFAAGDSAPPAIHVRNVTVAYEGKPVLRSVSFDVPGDQMIGIVGPNGAGKSTLLKAILGLVPIDAGRIELFGQPIETQRQRIAYVPQTEAVDWDFPVTVFDVVMMGRHPHRAWWRWPGRRDRDAAMEALEQVGMDGYVHRHIRRLSGGQQKRVFLARALCQQADILLLDEPFAGVDAATERAIFNLVRVLTQQHKTLLIVNHDLSVLSRFDRVLLLNHRVVAYGPPDEIVNDNNLRLTYGGKLSLLDRAEEALKNTR